MSSPLGSERPAAAGAAGVGRQGPGWSTDRGDGISASPPTEGVPSDAGRSAPPGRLVVLASGSGSNLQALLDDGLPVVAVITNRREAFALDRARRRGVEARFFGLGAVKAAGGSRRDYDAQLAGIVAAHEPDFVVLAGWMHVLSSAFLDQFPDRVVNLHPALPGAFPGAHAIDDAFAAYQQGHIDHTGVMVHLVPDEGVDNGPVLATVEVPIRPDDTVETLTERIHAHEHRLLCGTIRSLLARPGV